VRLALCAALCMAILLCQGVSYSLAHEQCPSFKMSRFERVLWLSPVFFGGPFTAAALVFLFVHDRGRFSFDKFWHRWTWHYAVINLLSSLFNGSSELFRDCHEPGSLAAHLGNLGETLWLLTYSITQALLLFLIHSKVRSLSQNVTARCLYANFACMAFWLVILFVPLLFWPGFKMSPWRALPALCFMGTFAVSTVIATRAILAAVRVAELHAAKRELLSQTWFHETTQWARVTAFSTFLSMATCTLLQFVLFWWMVGHYQRSALRIAADWVCALDYAANAFCVACLSGMIGPTRDLPVPEEVELVGKNEQA